MAAMTCPYRLHTAPLLVLLAGCADIDLGSNVIWQTSSESGTLDDWFVAPGGGLMTDTAGLEATVDTTAHSGDFGLLLTSNGNDDGRGTGAWRSIAADGSSYAAWFYLPDTQDPNDLATLMLFAAPLGDAPDPGDEGLRVQLRTLPNGDHLLQAYNDPRPYRSEPLPYPPPLVASRQWFHVEARLDRSSGFDVWLDGRHVYRIEPPEPLDFGEGMYFAVACDVEDRVVGSYRVFVDDIMIAASRITPDE